MPPVTFRRMAFGSFVKLSVLMAVSIGLVFGFLFLLVSLVNGNVTVNDAAVTGYAQKVITGLIVFVVCPIGFAVAGAVGGTLGYLPFTLLLKLTKGLKLELTE